MPLKAASALIAILQVVSSLVVLEIILEMFGACEWPWEKTKYAAKRRTTGPIKWCLHCPTTESSYSDFVKPGRAYKLNIKLKNLEWKARVSSACCAMTLVAHWTEHIDKSQKQQNLPSHATAWLALGFGCITHADTAQKKRYNQSRGSSSHCGGS